MKKQKKPLISVVIPAFNEEKYISACLLSLKEQSFTDFEIIVVDNNSTDNTAKIARKFGAKVVRENIQGMTPARERGFMAARAEIIARTDADTTHPSNWLELIYKTFKNYPHIVALTGPYKSHNKLIPDHIYNVCCYWLFVILPKLLSGHILLLGSNMAIRKSAWKKITIHKDDTLVHEDMDIACHLAQVGQLHYFPKLKGVISYRRISENPFAGLKLYLIEYIIRYYRTLWLHHPFLRRYNV